MGQAREHSWSTYLSASDAWDAMYEACRNATRSIEFEEYIFENDAVGESFLKLFAEKARLGIKVFVVVDIIGSATLYGAPLVEDLRRCGGTISFFHRLSLWDYFRPSRWFPRTHIKTLLVDSREAFVGSVCLASRMREWRETQVCVTGPVVDQIRAAFESIQFGKKRKNPACEDSAGECEEISYLQTNPLISCHDIYREFVRKIRDAKNYVYISSPFFAPNRRFRRLIQRKAREGIDVKILVPQTSDFKLADWILLSYARQILKSGARLFLYRKSMLHQKTMVLDDGWATVGSTNVDVLSFFRNREANLVIRHPPMIAELKQQFFDDLENAVELTLAELERVPLWKIIFGRMGRLIKNFL